MLESRICDVALVFHAVGVFVCLQYTNSSKCLILVQNGCILIFSRVLSLLTFCVESASKPERRWSTHPHADACLTRTELSGPFVSPLHDTCPYYGPDRSSDISDARRSVLGTNTLRFALKAAACCVFASPRLWVTCSTEIRRIRSFFRLSDEC
jgi:hypothetical protein